VILVSLLIAGRQCREVVHFLISGWTHGPLQKLSSANTQARVGSDLLETVFQLEWRILFVVSMVFFLKEVRWRKCVTWTRRGRFFYLSAQRVWSRKLLNGFWWSLILAVRAKCIVRIYFFSVCPLLHPLYVNFKSNLILGKTNHHTVNCYTMKFSPRWRWLSSGVEIDRRFKGFYFLDHQGLPPSPWWCGQ
jgi:hypothetical protein